MRTAEGIEAVITSLRAGGAGTICYVTPKDKLEGRDLEIKDARDHKLSEARQQ